jgi:hypothetical protein
MKSALVVLPLLVVAAACKPHSDVPPSTPPDAVRYEPVSTVVKDIETGQVPLTVSYKNAVNERTNQVVGGVGGGQVEVDLSPIQARIEAFQKAQPDYALYFRVEIRPFRSDTVLTDGNRKIRAGCLCRVDASRFDTDPNYGVGGPLITAKDPNTSWEFVTAQVRASLQELIVPRLQQGQKLKILLAVYDFNRFTKDPTAYGTFDGTAIKPWEYGGSRVLYRGWNVEP